MKRYGLFFLLVALLLGLNLPLQAEEEDVILMYFLAETDPQGIRLEWKTASEVAVLGFRIKRADHVGDPYETIDVLWEGEVVNFIPANWEFPEIGGLYEVWDVAAASGQTYWYMLVVVDWVGIEELNGPVSAVAGGIPIANEKLFLPLVLTP